MIDGDLTNKKDKIEDLRKKHEESIEEEKEQEDLVKKYDKERNERCFLPNKEKINYDSIILLELFNQEKFSDLIKGLDKLYENSQEELNYHEIFDKNKLSFGGWTRLPIISNSNIEDIPIISMDIDLGSHIKFIKVYLHDVLPSMVMLKIHAYYDNNVSEKLNEIIYKYHDSKIVYSDLPNEIPNQRFLAFTTSTHSGPKSVKTEEITNFRSSLKKEVINFFSEYFKGVFFELSPTDSDIVPSIEIYSLDYPKEKEDLLQWAHNYHGFLGCFRTYISEYNCFKLNNKDDSFLFLNENSNEQSFSNSFIFINVDKDSSHELDFISFKSVAFSRWLQIQEQTVAKFGSILSEEIGNLQNNQLEDVLKTRKIISKSIFQFELFKTEFKLIRPENNGFKLIDDSKYDLNASLMEQISEKIKNVDELINTFNKHFNVVLGLKNVEYSKNMQNKVYILSFLVLTLTIVQIILAFKSEIMALFANS
ncbi:hypothetical protein [uncultured Methanobacterium sp.]|uniref:hypothetical protein n=1 Tax=uncultured Methanobacterium sp. TaxID=176306 RepID=UPI002AA6F991|nr:hypothetical protein [uncultured Methanobacterium sp.]